MQLNTKINTEENLKMTCSGLAVDYLGTDLPTD